MHCYMPYFYKIPSPAVDQLSSGQIRIFFSPNNSPNNAFMEQVQLLIIISIFHFVFFSIFRLLVFSPHDITSVRISIDNTPLSSKVEHVEGPLYVSLWQPDLYSSGLHRITVVAKVCVNICYFTSAFKKREIIGQRRQLRCQSM